MEIQRVKINHQGYDASGSYWGAGPKLYRLAGETDADRDNDGTHFRIGVRVRLHPATDLWMRGCKYGIVVRVGRKYVHIKLDALPGIVRLHPNSIEQWGVL